MMQKLNPESKKIMEERFGKDSIIALASMDGNVPCVRLTDNILFSHGTRYDIDFSMQ